MTETLLFNDPQAVARLDSVACILEWTRSMSLANRKRFLTALLECSDDGQQAVVARLSVVKDPRTPPAERQRALQAITDTLFLPFVEDGPTGQNRAASAADAATPEAALAHEARKSSAQEEAFAQRLRQLLEAKQISQQELAKRAGCSQPAISLMLSRRCRPQRRTLLRLAEALNVDPRALWPDLDVSDMLDAVASFEQDDYTMTAAEASALAGTAPKNRPTIRAKSLPARP